MNTKRFASTMGVLLPSFLLMAGAGCSATDNGPTNTGGSQGVGGGSSGDTALVFDPGGYVAMGPTTKGVQGAFFGYGDGAGDKKCQAAGHTDCSTVNVVFDSIAQSVCATGTGALVPGTPPDYSAVFGAGVGLDLNNPGGDGGVKAPYNGTTAGVTGVGFTLNTGATYGSDFRVEFLAVGQDSVPPSVNARFDTVGGTNAVLNPDGSVQARFADANIQYDTTDIAKADATKLLSIQWHVATNINNAVPYNFCLTKIHLLTN